MIYTTIMHETLEIGHGGENIFFIMHYVFYGILQTDKAE